MQEFGAWGLLSPAIAIFLAISTRQVVLALIAGSVAGFLVLSNFDIGIGLESTVDGVVGIFQSEGAVKTLLFTVMISGLIHLARVTGGMQGLVALFSERLQVVKGRRSTQLMAGVTSSIIFIDSYLAMLTSGAATSALARKHRVSREQTAYVLKNMGIASWSSVMANGWGAAMMGVIAVQIDRGVIGGNPFGILSHSILFNFFAWASIGVVLLSIFTRFSFPRMRQANLRAAQGIELRDGATPLAEENNECVPGQKPCVSNLLVPLLVTIVCTPLWLYITGDGNILNGSGSTSVLWAVLVGQAVGFVHYVFVKRTLTIEAYFGHLMDGYKAMMPMVVVLTLAFLIGDVASQLKIGTFLADEFSALLPAGLIAAFVFLVSAIISISTGTSWGTFSIMIPIGIQLAVTAGADPYLVIGAAISGSIFGDTISPISDTGIVTATATGNDLMEHIKTQLPYCLTAAAVALTAFVLMGLSTSA
ncbi:Na+/H+ antiporter NhaC family protein [Stutzerimonas stutzeri]|uniref:Na+/H+ antiporter NhaC family protein n=1 Tax=Stutzerimonas stutzeri TaxID=316 RepID=UPI001C2E5483|nr:Na+/H+ antiporter NhaC family protein [Stutzerimonas stutzeri]